MIWTKKWVQYTLCEPWMLALNFVNLVNLLHWKASLQER